MIEFEIGPRLMLLLLTVPALLLLEAYVRVRTLEHDKR